MKTPLSPAQQQHVQGGSQFFNYILYIGFGIIGVILMRMIFQQALFFTMNKKTLSEIDTHNTQNTFQEASSSAEFRIPILLYHYVEYVKDPKDIIRTSLTTPPNTFEGQIKTLIEAGYTFLTANDLSNILNERMPMPNKPILLTFDDGHWDLETDILPILMKYHVRATAYIISGFIGRPDFLTDVQLRHVIQSGLVEIGAHTVRHIELAKQPSTLVSNEVMNAKRSLEHSYHIHVTSFAYPSGSFDQQTVEAVIDAGYDTAMSTIPGVVQSNKHRYFLYRIRPGMKTGESLLTFLHQNQFTNK